MKETVKTSRTAGYLEKIFRALNAKYFGGQLEEPIITIQSTPRAYGHVTVAKAWHKGTTTRHELNIGAGTLDRPIENVVATMLHECVHLWNMQQGIQDTSRGGAYHNKRFRDAATARDLDISYDPRIGWSITQPTDALCEFILDQGWTDIQMNRIEWSFTPRGLAAEMQRAAKQAQHLSAEIATTANNLLGIQRHQQAEQQLNRAQRRQRARGQER